MGLLHGHFGAICTLRGHFDVTFGYMRVTLESLWSIFKKHSFSQSILMILCNSGVHLGDLGGTLGSLLAYEGDFGTLWYQFGSTLEALWTSEGDFGPP